MELERLLRDGRMLQAVLGTSRAEIDALEAKAHEVHEDAKEKYAEQLSALRVKRDEGAKKLEEMKAASESAWEQVKVEADKAWVALKDSVQTFQSHYKV